MNNQSLRGWVFHLAWLSLFLVIPYGACAGPRSSGPEIALASASAASDVPGTLDPGAAGRRDGAGSVNVKVKVNVNVKKISPETLRDPALRSALMQRIILQLVRQTREVPADRYDRELRPRLRRQLREAGFAEDEVDFVLRDVDGSRGV